jgi:hypothetical protein
MLLPEIKTELKTVSNKSNKKVCDYIQVFRTFVTQINI